MFHQVPWEPEQTDGIDLWHISPRLINFKTTNHAKKVAYTKMHLLDAIL